LSGEIIDINTKVYPSLWSRH